jgi:hypothetical protein
VQDGVTIEAGQDKSQQAKDRYQPPVHGIGPLQLGAAHAKDQQGQAFGGRHVHQGGAP